jgi:hypothetical protein
LGDRLALHPIALSGFGTKSPLATEAAISLLHRSENDDVAIIRNENSVELNLIFNANAGDPIANVLMDAPEKCAGLEVEPRGRQRSNLLSTIKQPGADGDPMINAEPSWS